MITSRLRVKRIINNNIVLVEDFEGQEVVAIGKGLGHSKKVNSLIDSCEITKTYVLVDKRTSRKLMTMFEEIPFEIILLSQQIVDYASVELSASFNVNLVIVLADHINFSLSQYRNGNEMPVLINEEIARFYKNEHKVGIEAVKMINKTLSVSIKESEAAAIAFHLVSAQDKGTNHDALRIMKGVKEIIEIVEKTMSTKLDEELPAYSRFIIHLKFFMRTILLNQNRKEEASFGYILAQIESGYDIANICVKEIAKHISSNYGYHITDNDRLYLVIHIVRVVSQNYT